jgi:hypothetical protein
MSNEKPPAVPVQQNPKNSDDGLLDSLGKAIADPVKTGAENEEPSGDAGAGKVPPRADRG